MFGSRLFSSTRFSSTSFYKTTLSATHSVGFGNTGGAAERSANAMFGWLTSLRGGKAKSPGRFYWVFGFSVKRENICACSSN